MKPWMEIVLTVFTSVLASSGLWAMILRKIDKRDAQEEMLAGLAYDRILYLGMRYIERGYVLQDEYENLKKFLYEPYERLGGDGAAKRVMSEVDKLPIRKSPPENGESTL